MSRQTLFSKLTKIKKNYIYFYFSDHIIVFLYRINGGRRIEKHIAFLFLCPI